MRERTSPENVILLWVFWCITISPVWAFCTVRPVPKWPDLPSVSAKQEAGPSVLPSVWWCFTADPEPWMQNWQLWMNVCPTITGLPRDMDRCGIAHECRGSIYAGKFFRCTDSAGADLFHHCLKRTAQYFALLWFPCYKAFPFSGECHLCENPEVKRKELLSLHNMMWLNIFDSTYAYYYALTGMPERFLHYLKTICYPLSAFSLPADLWWKWSRTRSFFHRKCTQKL